MTDRIDHAAEARRLMDLTGEGYVVHEGWTETTALMATLDAQTHASLALVEQQRIANLIALATQDEHDDEEVPVRAEARDTLVRWVPRGMIDEYPELRPDIAAALGIEAVEHE